MSSASWSYCNDHRVRPQHTFSSQHINDFEDNLPFLKMIIIRFRNLNAIIINLIICRILPLQGMIAVVKLLTFCNKLECLSIIFDYDHFKLLIDNQPSIKDDECLSELKAKHKLKHLLARDLRSESAYSFALCVCLSVCLCAPRSVLIGCQ